MLDAPRLLAADPWVTRRPVTVTEYHRMGEVGILGDRDRVELIEGELVAMSRIGSHHHGTVNKLTMRWRSRSASALRFRCKASFARCEPEPCVRSPLPQRRALTAPLRKRCGGIHGTTQHRTHCPQALRFAEAVAH